MAIDDEIKLTRNQLAELTENHAIIKQLEKLIALVNDLAARVTVLEAGP